MKEMHVSVSSKLGGGGGGGFYNLTTVKKGNLHTLFLEIP